MCILKGNGDNCTCIDCIVLYGGECLTTPINNALDKFDCEVEELFKRGKNLSHYQLYKIIKPVFKTIKKDNPYLSVKYLDDCYKMFMPLMYFSWGIDKEIRNTRDYKEERYSVYWYITKYLEKDLTN